MTKRQMDRTLDVIKKDTVAGGLQDIAGMFRNLSLLYFSHEFV
jgi:hypothetical protein